MQGGTPVATPMSANAWLHALQAEGITNIVQMPGWKTHNRDSETGKPFGPVHGLAIHHTAGVGSGMAQFCHRGTTDLPGPLCHDFLAKDGTLYLVGHGRTNHAGTVAANTRTAIINDAMPLDSSFVPDRAEPYDGNDFLYGLEIENKGDGKDPYPAKQYDIAVRWAAARARHHGWTAGSIAGHKELTRRKIDPSFSIARFRRDVAARLKPKTPPTPKPSPPQEASTSRMDFTQLSRRVPLVIPAGQARPVFFEVELDDQPGDHGDGGRTVLDGGHYTGTVNVWLPGDLEVRKVTVRMVHELADGTVSPHSLGDIWPDPADETTQAVSITGEVQADRKLFVEIHNHGDTPITVPRVDVRLFSQAI